MTTVKIFRKAGLGLYRRVIKHAEEVIKDGGKVVRQYQLKEDPVMFARDVLDFMAFDYQQKLLYDTSKRICACMGRQTGKSSTIAAKALHFASSGRNRTILIVSATLRQSMLMFDKINRFINSGELVGALEYRTRTKVVLANGSSIIALPCGNDGGTLRGYTADVLIIDEASFMPEEVIMNVLMPMIATTKGRCWMLSTPWDRNHVFYKIFNDARWSTYHLPSTVNPLIDDEFLEEQRELIGEERFAMEYLAEFVDDSRSYFPVSLIRQCASDDTYQLEGELFAGYDPGGKESYAALVVVRRIDDVLYVVHKKAEKGKSYTEFDAEIADLNKKHHFKLMVDQTGLGNPIIEHVRELGMDVEGMTLTARKKEELLSNLKILMEDRKLVLPHDIELHNSVNAIEFERTRSGGFRFYKRNGTYDDLGYALALACFAARQDGVKGVIIKI